MQQAGAGLSLVMILDTSSTVDRRRAWEEVVGLN